MLPLQNIPIDYKPWGMQAGGMVGEAEADNSASNLLNLQESILGNIVKQKDAALAQDEMNNPLYRDTRIQGLIGKSQQDIAKGKEDLGTVAGKINATNAENKTKTSVQKTLDVINTLDNFTAQYDANGPIGIRLALDSIQDLDQREKIIQRMRQNGIGDTIAELKAYNDSLKRNLADNPIVRGKIAETEATGKWHQSVAGIQGKTARDVEQMRIDAGKYEKNQKSSEEMWFRFQALSPDKQYLNAQAALASNRHPITGAPLTDLDRAALEQIVISAKAILDQKAATSPAGNPNAIAPAGVTGLPAQQTPQLPGVGGASVGQRKVWDGQKWVIK